MNRKKIITLIEDILQKSTDLKVSEVLPKALTLAKVLDDKDFEKWILLETSGYFDTNPALTKDVFVPDYRKVPGQYHDKYNRPLIIDDPSIFQMVNNYALRQGVAELEAISLKDGYSSFRNPFVMSTLKKMLGIEVDTFTFSCNSVKSVLTEIRAKLISWIMEKHKSVLSETVDGKINTDTPMELSYLHPIVQQTAGDLYRDGHYRQAILDTYIALVNAVKVKSGRHDLDNTPLMQTVFSIKAPLISVSTDADEQLGFMWLFSGAVMGIRNPKAHRLIDQKDPQRTLEWLSFASVLLRVLDDSKVEGG
jgi:uncharacterized protein (TIGR02391 family)